MAREYRVLLGYAIVFTLVYAIKPLSFIWIPIFIALQAGYLLYRNSTAFLTFRSRDNRFFIKSNQDRPYTSIELYRGVALLAAGLIYYLTRSYWQLNEYIDITILSVLLVTGVKEILARFFFTALPVLEILIKNNTVEIFKSGNLIKQVYQLKSFQISNQAIILSSGADDFELTELELTDEQVERLTGKFTTLVSLFKSNKQVHKQSVDRLKKYFSMSWNRR